MPERRPRMTIEEMDVAQSLADGLTIFNRQRFVAHDAHAEAGATHCEACGGPVAASEAIYDGLWRIHQACQAGGLMGAVQAVLRLHGQKDEAMGLEEVDAQLLGGHGYANGLAFWTTRDGMRQALYQPEEKPPKPWAHVSAERVDRLLAGVRQLPRLRAEAGRVAGRPGVGL